ENFDVHIWSENGEDFGVDQNQNQNTISQNMVHKITETSETVSNRPTIRPSKLTTGNFDVHISSENGDDFEGHQSQNQNTISQNVVQKINETSETVPIRPTIPPTKMISGNIDVDISSENGDDFGVDQNQNQNTISQNVVQKITETSETATNRPTIRPGNRRTRD